MSVIAITPDYEKHIEFRDLEKNFHGNRILYLHWEDHLSFCAALAFPLPAAMPFGAFLEAVVKPAYSAHPDSEKIDWTQAIWTVDGQTLTPDLTKSLEENGVRHKSLVRFWTPGLDGRNGSGC
jgi:phenol/toluene 2-monooxygenase (NADH) P4/A4